MRLWMEVRRDERVLKMGGDKLFTARWLRNHGMGVVKRVKVIV